MKRIARTSAWLKASGLSLLIAAVAVNSSTAQQKPGVNPLRTQPREPSPVKQASATAPVAKTAPAASVPVKPVPNSSGPVGSAVRTPGQANSAPASTAPKTTGMSKPAPARPSSSNQSNAVQQSNPVQQAAYRRRVPTPEQIQPTTRHEVMGGTSILQGTVTVDSHPGQIIDDSTFIEGGIIDGGFGPGEGWCDDGSCYQCCLVQCPSIPLDDLSLFAGVQGFTGPKNRGQTGSFGFHEGLNWGAPMPCMAGCMGMQLGARVTQSDLSGAEFTPKNRNQLFVTGGLFRRVDWGLQGGIVFDYLHDDWYTNTDLSQLRAELAWVFPCAHELGFWLNSSLNEEFVGSRVFTNAIANTITNERWEATDVYAFYYRHHFQEWSDATARLYAGFTGESDGLIGADVHVPLGCDFALEAGFTYLSPEESSGPAGIGNEQESWNVAFSLVWYPGCGNNRGKSYTSPLFNVADNGSFLVDRID